MHVIEQKLIVRDWPLQKPGDEVQLGCVVAVGAFPLGGGIDGSFNYADFIFGDRYVRYRLPNDTDLINHLLERLVDTVAIARAGYGISGSLCACLTNGGLRFFHL